LPHNNKRFDPFSYKFTGTIDNVKIHLEPAKVSKKYKTKKQPNRKQKGDHQ